MKTLPEPEFTVREILESCADGLQDQDLARRLLGLLPTLEEAEQHYGSLGANARLFEIAPTNDVGGVVSSPEMTTLYKGSLSRQGSRSRRFYDRLKMAAPNDICPLCGQRVVKTLDHYLPKSTHPGYALTPVNLVPACSDCNKGKLDRQPSAVDEQTLHPYFDDVDGDSWLVAEIRESSPPAAVFSVRPHEAWDAVKARRLTVHFRTFGLGELYAAQAGSEMVSIRFALADAAEAKGPDGVHAFLAHQARMRSLAARNSWVAALYTALAESVWFCTEGHGLLG
jgi:hypothetical protein